MNQNCHGNTDCAALLDCGDVFASLRVRSTLRQGVWVEWSLQPDFREPGPHQFRLQTAQVPVRDPAAWLNATLPVVDATVLVDEEPRSYGAVQRTHYRVQLTTGNGKVFYSPSLPCWGDLPVREQRLIANRERIWKKLVQGTPTGQPGYLLKRKNLFEPGCEEAPCPGTGVIDFLTDEVLAPQHPPTQAAGCPGGFFAPIPCVYADVKPLGHFLQNQGQGTQDAGGKTTAIMLARPQLVTRDVWVSQINDYRYEIRQVISVEEIRGVPVLVQVGLNLLPHTDPVYELDVVALAAATYGTAMPPAYS